MSAYGKNDRDEIHSKVLRAGRRTYFFDVRATKADDYYLTITESKKHTSETGQQFYKKHKIYLYKEDFDRFRELLDSVTGYIVSEKGEEVISETHQSEYNDTNSEAEPSLQEEEKPSKAFTNVSFEDI